MHNLTDRRVGVGAPLGDLTPLDTVAVERTGAAVAGLAAFA